MGRLSGLVVFAGLLCVGVSESIISESEGGRGGGGHRGGAEGAEGPLLHRTKRSFPRGPLAYMNRISPGGRMLGASSNNDEESGILGEPMPVGQMPISVAVPNGGYYTKRYLLGRESDMSGLSHFREVSSLPQQAAARRRLQLAEAQQQQLQQQQQSNEEEYDAPLTSYPILARRNARRYPSGSGPGSNVDDGPLATAEDLTNQLAPLTDEELQTILLLLDGYALSSKGGNPGPQSPRIPHRAPTSSHRNNNNYNNINQVIADQVEQQQLQQLSPNPNYPLYNPNYLSPDDLRRVARMYAMGKRENEPQQEGPKQGQGRFFDLQQEHSPGFFEEPSSIRTSERLGLEFLTPKRSKRVGGGIPVTNPEMENKNRIKKETEGKGQKVKNEDEDENDQVLENNSSSDDDGETEPPRALPLAMAGVGHGHGAGVTTDKAVVTSGQPGQEQPQHPTNAATGQIPAPSQGQTNAKNVKAKKSIDWSQYFGIDKKSGHSQAPQRHHQSGSEGVLADQQKQTKGQGQESKSKNDGKAAVTSTSAADAASTEGPSSGKPSKTKAIVAARITEPNKTVMKESKDHKKLRMREENETENKSDRKWILNEFYKNMAMSTNVKRKRDVSADETDQLADLEEKMKSAGDDIIWDALKYTGAHKDEPLSPLELAQVKKDIIQKLATAYNLEKIREAIDSFREQLLAIKTNNV